jgi:hypothetical protein
MCPSIKSKALQQFTEAAKTLANSAVHDRKEKGGKVVGYFCSYVRGHNLFGMIVAGCDVGSATVITGARMSCRREVVKGAHTNE